MNKIVKIIVYILLYIWQLPQNIVGLCFLLFTTKKQLYKKYKYEYVYLSPNMSGGISLGNYIILNSRYELDNQTIDHERGHCKWSRILGWLYLLVIGISSVLHAAFHNCENYYHFFTERWADTIMGIKRILKIK